MSSAAYQYGVGVRKGRQIINRSRYTVQGATITNGRAKNLIMSKTKLANPAITLTRRKKPRETQGQNSEYVAKTLKYGRKPRNTFNNLSKFVKSNISRTVFSIHAASRFGGVRGAIGLSQIQTAAGSPVVAPLHLYDLTGAVNTVSGTITIPQTSSYLSFSNETATAIGSLISNTFQLTVESAPNANALVQNYPGPSSVMKWAQARMMFYAPTTVPSKISVSFIQFIDEELCPNSNVAATKVLTARATAWYQAFMKKQMYNPIETTQALGFKGIKILHKETFIMNPKETTEATSTHYKQLDIFKWMNRRCNYLWNQDVGTSTSNDDPGQNLGEVATTVHPRARVYLMISGQSGLNTGDSGTVHPSYDLVLRTCHEQLAA